METKKAVSLKDLDVQKKCESGFRFPFLDTNGKETGIYFTVLGAHAPAVSKWLNAALNARRKQDAIQLQRDPMRKKVEARDIEEDIEFSAEYMSIRLIAWEGIEEPCTPENALALCSVNPLAVEQIKAASEELGNFTRTK